MNKGQMFIKKKILKISQINYFQQIQRPNENFIFKQLLQIPQFTYQNLKIIIRRIKMSAYQLSKLRIHKQLKQIQENPIQNTLVAVRNERDVHFCFYNIEAPYTNGFYHGVLELPENYPFSAPKFKFLTGNGRFEVGKYVCTTFTSYHQESWSSAWSIRTILMGIMSFFLSDEGGYGTIQQSSEKREYHAERSLSLNLLEEQFRQLFVPILQEMGVKHKNISSSNEKEVIELEKIQMSSIMNEEIAQSKQIIDSALLVEDQNIGRGNVQNNSNRVVILLYVLLVLIIAVIVMKSLFL